ncbi:DUF1836 domain-containing protein [Anaerobacillus alkaliphilus]|uniref:DUF1836 domain-containing protein n=1 Tax=Anaerobacillus alkaliphilus TaxID=1548597 RepID=A0A4V1LGY3_9BACI|nr:DUF1836 domain-containing protein [Anaerobacillus alkaliphilus]RXJ04335.1 DUF1836 domain-containing protein [Anaerobacillus alkaliphilus]
MDDKIKQLGLDKIIPLDDMPNIDLYMDQVIQLFENTYGETKRSEDEKILTKTMINNYAKGKVFFPIQNKKYSKEHLILLSLIYQLKGALSINDIKLTLEGLNSQSKDMSIEDFYTSYLQLFEASIERFYEDFAQKTADVKQVANHKDSDYLEKALLITTLVSTSNFYRRAAEKLIDELGES